MAWLNFKQHTSVATAPDQNIAFQRAEIWRDPRLFLACGLGSGASKIAPGTMGTLVALFLYLLFPPLTPFAYVSIWIIFCILGIYLADYAERKIGIADYQGIVCDEIVGFWVVTFMLPPGVLWLGIAFVLFRVFDITKPWPIDVIQRCLPGGFGCVLDDVFAGIYAWLVLHGLIHVASRFQMF